MSDIQTLISKINRVDTKLSTLLAGAKKQTWVKGTVLTKYSIWKNKRELDWARRCNLVEFRTNKSGQVEYLFESISDKFLTIDTAPKQ